MNGIGGKKEAQRRAGLPGAYFPNLNYAPALVEAAGFDPATGAYPTLAPPTHLPSQNTLSVRSF